MSLLAKAMVARLGGRRFAAAIMFDALGSGVVMPLSVLYFTVHKGMAPTTVGLGLAIGGGVSLLLGPSTGQFIDAVGSKRALLLAWLLSAIAFVCFPLVHTLLTLAILQAVVNTLGGLGWNSASTMLASLTAEDDLSKAMAASYSLRNFGFGAGGLLATLALAIGGVGFDIAVYANAASFLVAGAFAAGVNVEPPAASAGQEQDQTTIWTVLRDRRYMGLTALNGLIAFNQVGLQVVLPLWVVLYTHAPREIVGLLFTLNTVMVVTLQVWIAGSVREVGDTPRIYLRAALMMILGAFAYTASHYVGGLPAILLLVLATALLTLTEMFASACAFVVSLRLASPLHRGKYLSVFGLGFGFEATAGPTVATALIAAGVLMPWPALAAIVFAGALGSAVVTRSSGARVSGV